MKNEKLVVAQLIETMNMGGAENLAVRIANSLAESGHHSHLIVMGEPGVLSGQISPDVQAHYLCFERASITNPLAFAVSQNKGYRLLRQLIEGNGIQILQTHLPGSNFWGLLLTLNKVCPVLATIHNNHEFEYGDSDNAVRLFLRKKAYQEILKKCAGTVAVSEKVKTSLIRDLGVIDEKIIARISVVKNCVSVPEILSEDEVTTLRQGWGVDSGQMFVLAAGRFSEQKNFADLISAVAMVKEKNPNFHLVVGGDGEQRSDLEKMVKERGLGDHVSLPGNLLNLNQIMLAADVFVMSSLWEGLPLVLLEAMATGLPVVGYDIKGLDEVVENEVQGLISTTGEPGGLAISLLGLFEDEKRRRRMGHAARDLVKEKYNFKDLVESLVTLYFKSRSL